MRHLLAFALLFAVTFPSPLFAKRRDGSELSDNHCNEMIKECFSLSGDNKLSCFYTAGKHAFCEGSDLGKLSLKRWSYGPTENGGQEEAPAFLGPQLVDQTCIANFDNQWSGLLVNGVLSTEITRVLSSSLDKCKRSISNELMRP